MSTKAQKKGMDRRSFLKVSMLASGALIVGVGYEDALLAGELSDGKWIPNLYVRIDVDGKVTVLWPRSRMDDGFVFGGQEKHGAR